MTIFIRNVLGQKGWGVTTVAPTMPMLQVVDLLVAKRIGGAPVVDEDGTVVGLISERDVMNGLSAHHQGIRALTVADVMSTQVVTAGPEETVLEAMRLMTVHRCRHIPIVEDGKLLGLLSIGDVVKYRLDEAESELDAMRAYVTESGPGHAQAGGAR